jgi:hypothetical protein
MSAARAETRHESEEASFDPLTTIKGIGVIVMLHALQEADPFIITVTEQEERPETGKYPDEVGIIQETVKVQACADGILTPEEPRDTLLGAMTEVLSEEDVRRVGRHFHRVNLPGGRDVTTLPSIGSLGRVEVIVYDGPANHQFGSLVDEVKNIQWRRLSSLLKQREGVRETTRELLNHAVGQRLIAYGQQQYDQRRTEPLFTERDSLREVHRRREQKKDITVFMR